MESMAASGDLSLLDLHDLPDSQREILHCLAYHVPVFASNLVRTASLDPVRAQPAIDVLIDQGHNQRLPHGRMNAALGQVNSQTTRADQLYLALLTTRAEIDHQLLQEACSQ
jgi:hypothetical protein